MMPYRPCAIMAARVPLAMLNADLGLALPEALPQADRSVEGAAQGLRAVG